MVGRGEGEEGHLRETERPNVNFIKSDILRKKVMIELAQ